MKKPLRHATVLGIETSCDETAVALVRTKGVGKNYDCQVLWNRVHTQIPIHRQHGGVVPEVAAREHAVRLPLILNELAKDFPLAKLKKQVDAIAVTAGPGLVTSLLVGVEVARTISFAWNKPMIPVNHLEGHIYANLLSTNSQILNPKSETLKSNRKFVFPVLVLIVSGGHTELVLMKNHLQYKLLGSTRDDAAGEAFDKIAKLLGLSYPGGPALSKLAKNGEANINFPRPMLDQNNFDFSFAGLKTAVLLYLEKNKKFVAKDIAASAQLAIVETLVEKTLRAAKKYNPKTVVLAGGVAANTLLRSQIKERFTKELPKIIVMEPSLAYVTDNAAMIAAAGGVRFLNGHHTTWQKVDVHPHRPLK